jgi:hypothetical protein
MQQAAGTSLLTIIMIPILLMGLMLVVLAGVVGGAQATTTLGCGAAGTGAAFSGITLDDEQMGNAQTIVAVAAGDQLPPYAAVVAVATAYQESKLRNIGVQLDHDSEGLFQLRVGLWGKATADDPVASTEWFLDRLVAVPDWQAIPLTVAAQTVQRSAYPDAYAAWQPMATGVISQLWPVAAQQVDDQGAATAGPGADPADPDATTAAPACTTGIGGTATDSIPCSTGGGQVVQAPGNVPIRICSVGPYVVDTTLAPGVAAMLAASKAAGLDLGGGAYRSNAEQIATRRQNCGPTDYDIYDKPSGQCSPQTARPGTSMHEWGLALDITSNGLLIRSHSNPACRWLQANAGLYGLRNLPGEPWHWSSNGH